MSLRGSLKASVWENYNDKDELYHTVTLARNYEGRDGKPRDSNSFSASELLRVSELAREGHAYVRGVRREMAAERRADHQAQRQTEGPAQESRPARFRGQPEPGLER
ncbi:MAG: hypothetical protein AAGG56_12885 [Pseudomonadota bacterium]